MTLDETLQALAALGRDSTKKTLMNHGAPEPIFGVRIGDMKPLQKKIRGDQELALKLYATGISDAMYLAGMIADGRQMSEAQLDEWVQQASWEMIAGTTVPWVTAEHPEGIRIAIQWLDSDREYTAVAGWSTLAAVVAVMPDAELPIQSLSSLLKRVAKNIQSAPHRVRYAMNGFVISCGTYVAPLGEQALTTARQIHPVEVDMGKTACQVPEAESYILKSRRGNPVAPKRKTTRC